MSMTDMVGTGHITVYADKVADYNRLAEMICGVYDVAYSMQEERVVAMRGLFRKRLVVELTVKVEGAEESLNQIEPLLNMLARDVARL